MYGCPVQGCRCQQGTRPRNGTDVQGPSSSALIRIYYGGPMKHLRNRKKYWYKYYFEECVICGRRIERKERQYTPKPKQRVRRYEERQYACESHFQ